MTVAAPAPLAADAFARTVASGWGTADNGGVWTISTGATKFSVADGKGKVTMSAVSSGYTALLNSVSTSNADMSFDVSMDKAATGGGQYYSAIGRNVTGVGFYSAKVRVLSTGAVQLYLLKTVSGTETIFASQTVSGLTYSAGDTLKLRLQVTGANSTNLKVKLWGSGSEPTAWNLSATDATAGLQVAGGVGVSTYISGSSTNLPIVYSFDNLVVPAP